ncbi:leucine-rich repeat-containing protein 58, partial [Quercus suber]
MKRKLNDILRLDAFRVGTFGATSSSSAGIRTYSFSKNDHLLVAIEENKKALLSLVCSEESKDMVILVIGDAGLGKTTLIREVYQMIKENFNCNAWNCFLSILQNMDFSDVRTLCVFGGGDSSESIPKNLFYNFRYLSDLYLENVALHRIPKKVFKLTLLRHLSLRNTRIKSVPKSIKKLQNLRMFKLEESLVTDLPREITKLRSLLCLSVSCQGIKDVAVGVEVFLRRRAMPKLQKLILKNCGLARVHITKKMHSQLEEVLVPPGLLCFL